MTQTTVRTDEPAPAGRLRLVPEQFQSSAPVGFGEAQEQLAAGHAVFDERGSGLMGDLRPAQHLVPQPRVEATGFGGRAVDVPGRTRPYPTDPPLQAPQQPKLDQASQLSPGSAGTRDRFGNRVERQPLQLPGAGEAQTDQLLDELTIALGQPLVEPGEAVGLAGHDGRPSLVLRTRLKGESVICARGRARPQRRAFGHA
jgi:hypothetical protein